ncbi:MAG: phosphatase PAP2 family protein [Verrucomicrobiota bacterium]|nr:phosphatase PAP2 family protein [Verrucomicrobiota bacterium]
MDQYLLYNINVKLAHPLLDYFFVTISDLDVFYFLIVLAVLSVFIWGKVRGRIFLFMMLMCLVIGDSGIGWAIKRHTNRPRPHEAVEWVQSRHLESRPFQIGPLKIPTTLHYKTEPAHVTNNPRGRSMPSGHVLNNVALAILVTIYYRRLSLVAWVWAFLIAWSRIYTGSHYASDCAVSFGLAILYTPAIVFGLDWLWRNIRLPLLDKWRQKIPSLVNPDSKKQAK